MDKDKYTILHTFDSVEIKNETLVLCDIDNTLMYYEDMKKYDDVFNKYFNINSHVNLSHNLAENEMRESVLPKHTDKEGFFRMLGKIKDTNSVLVFITSRDPTTDYITKLEFKTLGISHENFYVHSIGSSISKGRFIVNNININNYDHIVFIDDIQTNLDSVKNYLKEKVVCYKFFPRYKLFST